MNAKKFLQNIHTIKTFASSPHNDVLDLTVPLHLFYIAMRKNVLIILEEFGLIESELDLLVSLLNAAQTDHTLSPTQLYDTLLFSSGGMTKMLKRLEERGLIERPNNPDDKRNKLVRLTSKGSEVALRAFNEILSYEHECFSVLDANEQETLNRLLNKLAVHLHQFSE
ncbi:MAG: MarR family winged helix-turn-helix transcriptional regulator [Sulfuricurvum sp.]